MHPPALKAKAVNLRRQGVSIPAMAKRLGIAKSTVSLWVRSTPLPEDVQGRLHDAKIRGSARGLEVLRLRRVAAQADLQRDTKRIAKLLVTEQNKDYWKMIAAILFWCEGSKRHLGTLTFINSDPAMVKTFLFALRKGFDLEERKFGITLHLHEYHSIVRQTEFWFEVTGIPAGRFYQPYIKPHTGKRTREGYPGCISLRYANAQLARTLSALYHSFAEMHGGIV